MKRTLSTTGLVLTREGMGVYNRESCWFRQLLTPSGSPSTTQSPWKPFQTFIPLQTSQWQKALGILPLTQLGEAGSNKKTETRGGWQLKKESSDFLAGVGQMIHGKRFLIHSQSPNAQPGGLLFCQKGRMTFMERFSFLNSGRFLKTYGCESLFPQLLDSTQRILELLHQLPVLHHFVNIRSIGHLKDMCKNTDKMLQMLT